MQKVPQPSPLGLWRSLVLVLVLLLVLGFLANLYSPWSEEENENE